MWRDVEGCGVCRGYSSGVGHLKDGMVGGRGEEAGTLKVSWGLRWYENQPDFVAVQAGIILRYAVDKLFLAI